MALVGRSFSVVDSAADTVHGKEEEERARDWELIRQMDLSWKEGTRPTPMARARPRPGRALAELSESWKANLRVLGAIQWH